MTPTTKSRRLAVVLLAALLVPGALVGACSSDNSNPQPGTPVYTVGNDGSTPVQSNDAGPSADAPSAIPDAHLPQADVVQPPEDAAACATDAGCWSCTPTTNSQFLNQCTASQCSPFPNATRLPDYDGGLPPLN